MKLKGNRRSSARRRRGVECVEVAITLPLLVIVCAATMQVCSRIHVSKMLHFATYEAVRAGGEVDGNEEIARKIFEDRTNALGIEGAVLNLSGGFDSAPPKSRITAAAYAPTAENSLPFPTYLVMPRTIKGGKVIYRKEE